MIAFMDIGDIVDDDQQFVPMERIPPAARRAVASVKVKRVSRKRVGRGDDAVEVTLEVISVRLADKLAALDKLCRHLNLFRDLPPLDQVLGLLPKQIAAEIRQQLEPTG